MSDDVKNRPISARRGKRIATLAVMMMVGIAVFVYVDGRFAGQEAARQQAGLTGISSDLASEPDRDADIYGMITSVKGNQITILKFDPSTMPGAKKDSSSEQEPTEENALSLGTSSTMPAGGPPSGGGMPNRPSSGSSKSGSSGGPGGGFGGSSSTRADKLEELKSTSIGTETIVVPVGIPVLVKSTGADGQDSAEAGNLTDLTSDTVIMLWLKDASINDNDATLRAAEFVNVNGTVDMDN